MLIPMIESHIPLCLCMYLHVYLNMFVCMPDLLRGGKGIPIQLLAFHLSEAEENYITIICGGSAQDNYRRITYN